MPKILSKAKLPASFLIFCFILTLLISPINCYESPSSCPSSKFYNYFSHACQTCPTGTTPSTIDNTYCNCTVLNYKNPMGIGFMHSTSCLPLSSPLATGQIALIYHRNGARLATPTNLACSSNAYPNADRTECIPCGYNMVYSSTLKQCICSDPSGRFYPVGGYCAELATSVSNPELANAENRLLYGMGYLGCTVGNPSKDACQILLNKCSEEGYRSSSNFCILLQSRISAGLMGQFLTTDSGVNSSIGIYASSVYGTDSTTVKNKLNFMVLEYNKYGELRDIKPLGPEILPCLSTQEDAVQFQSFGLNLFKTCLIADLQPSSSLYYDIYVLNSDSNYVQVLTVYQSGTFYKRYNRNGYNSVNMTYKSIPPLGVPFITLSSKSSPQVSTSSQTDTINLQLVGPFIAFNVCSLVLFIISFYKFMKYNPYDQNDPYVFFKVIFIFFLKLIRHWGITLWIWLFGVSMYCFCFYKFQQTVYLLLPDTVTQWLGYYDPFMVVFYLQFAFVFLSVIMLIYDLGAVTDYFLIDWEKEKNLSNFNIHMENNKSQISVWRKILLVNQLYELTITQILDLPLIIVFGIFFLDGLNWINLSYQIPNIDNINRDFSTSSTKNVVLAYFIITFIFFIIGVIEYVIRNLIRIWKPLPYENFVDLCCISNISLVIFDHELHGYYLHGMNPLGKAEGTLAYIQSVFEKESKSFGKSRAFKNNDPDQTQIFEVIYPRQIRRTFQLNYKTRYLQKLVGRAQDTSMLANPIPQNLQQGDYKQLQVIQNNMLDNFKYYLEGVKTSHFNIREQTFLQRLLSCPIDPVQIGKLPIFFKDYWHKFTDVILSGHEFTLLINVVNFINIFYIATNSVTIACLITMVICRLVVKNLADFFIKRNISRNTLIDDKFFS